MAFRGYSWLARDVTDVSIFGYPPCWCSTAGEIYICLYAIAVQLLEITMDSAEKEHVPSIDELCSKIPILSEYCRKLDDHVKRRYLEKIAEVGVDPVTFLQLLGPDSSQLLELDTSGFP